MARQQSFSDEQVIELRAAGASPVAIAQKLGVALSSVTRRIKTLEERAGAEKASEPVVSMAPEALALAEASLFNTQEAADANYRIAIAVRGGKLNGRSLYLTNRELIRAVAEVRAHVDLGVRVMETLYNVQQVRAFQDEVLGVLDEFEPGARAKVLERLRQKLAVRGALTGGGS